MIKKVLTFRASSIGDALLAKHLLENVHAQYPNARCGIVVAGRGEMVRNLLLAYPWIEIIEANRRSVRGIWKLWRNFRGSDLVITPGVKPGGKFGFASKVVARILARRGGLIGFKDASMLSPSVYDIMLPFDAVRAPRLLEHDVLRVAGIPITIESLDLTYFPQERALSDLGLESKKYIVMHLFAGAQSRGMSQKKRQMLIDTFAARYPNTSLVLTGTIVERDAIMNLRLPSQVVVAAGQGTVQDLATLIAESAVMVSVGTGPSHMASHLHHPLVVLVVCIGKHWCGPEQFGKNTYTHVHTRPDLCASAHDSRLACSPCIEGIDIEAVVADAGQYVSQFIC